VLIIDVTVYTLTHVTFTVVTDYWLHHL